MKFSFQLKINSDLMRKAAGNHKQMTAFAETSAGLSKQSALPRRPAKSIRAALAFAAGAMFVEAEPFGINFEQLFLRVPVLAFAAHALAENAGVQFAAARVADPI